VVLRNPSDRAQEFSLDVGKAFELPGNAARSYSAHSPWAADKSTAPITLLAGHPHRFMLEAFQVITLDAEPFN
jgi:hypothetical protein